MTTPLFWEPFLWPQWVLSRNLLSIISTSTTSPFLKFTLSLLGLRVITDAFTMSPTEAFLLFFAVLNTRTTEADELSTI